MIAPLDPRAAHIACLRANWPDVLSLHGGRPPKLIDLDRELVDALIDLPLGFGLCGPLEPELAENAPFFLKVAGFSFHDMPVFHLTEGRIDDVESLRLMVRELSPRMRWSLAALRRDGITPRLELHPWREIEPHLEFRCFFRNGDLVGISQADPAQVFPALVADARAIELELRDFVGAFIDDLPIENVVADVYFMRVQGALSPRLMELNPLVTGTGSGLFTSIAPQSLDGGFRYRSDSV